MSAPAAASGAGVRELTSVATHDDFLASAGGGAALLLFVSAWHPPCAQMRSVCVALAAQFPSVRFAALDAEGVAEVTERYPVESVPTSVVVVNGKVVGSLQGANAVELTALVTKHAAASSKPSAPAGAAAASASSSAGASATPAAVEEKEQLDARLAQLVKAAPVMAFIKGTPDAPRCGFTKQLLALFKEREIEFGSFDILSDQRVREGLKVFSNWPTYPQVFSNGELLGGLDVLKELAAAGELDALPNTRKAGGGNDALNERIRAIINQQRIMLFMKGTPEAPQCGFSNKTVALLHELGCADFGSFNVFSDEAVREGIKVLSQWATFPQLYIDGELIGGLDVLTELKESGELQALIRGDSK